MRKSVSVFLLFSIILLTSSCATVFKGSREEINFNSDPQRAEVYVNGNLMGETPVALKLESKKGYTIEFKKEGFKTKTVNIANNIGVGWIILDVLFGLVPVIVDAATGS